MTDHSEWEAVGRAIEQRMTELGLTKAQLLRAASLSDKTLKGYLEGRPIRRADKAAAITSALRWPPDAFDRILRGEAPMASRLGTATEASEVADEARARHRDIVAALNAEEARLSQLVVQLRTVQASIAQSEARIQELREDESHLRRFAEAAVARAEGEAQAAALSKAAVAAQRAGDPDHAPRGVLVELLLELMPRAELTRLLKERLGSTTVEPADENFAMAAEKGEQDTKKGRKRTRPSPDPEPEGP